MMDVSNSGSQNFRPRKPSLWAKIQGQKDNRRSLSTRKISACLFFRLLFPLFLALPFFSRVNAFSAIYIIFFFLHPFMPSPGYPRLPTSTKVYLILLLVGASLILVSQVCYLSLLYIWTDFRTDLTCESSVEQILRQVGLSNVYNADWYYYLIVVLPECIIISSVLVCCLFQKVCTKKPTRTFVNSTVAGKMTLEKQRQLEEHEMRFAFTVYLDRVSYSLYFLSIIAAACCCPSFVSLVYLIGFLVLGTCRALHVSHETVEPKISALLAAISGLNFVAIYLFQFEFLLDYVDGENDWRIFTGLGTNINYTCPQSNVSFDPLVVINVSDYSSRFIDKCNPAFVLIMFYMMAERLDYYIQSRKYPEIVGDRSKKSRKRDPHEMFKPDSLFYKILVKTNFIAVCTYVVNQAIANSYLLSVAVMIVWSILCHGFIALPLLLIAIYLWSRTDSNNRTHNFAPFLCIYCPIYIVIQHVMSVLLATDYVPDSFSIGSMNVTQFDIRLTSNGIPMIAYLGLQCLGMIPFWHLLHTFMKNFWKIPDPEPEERPSEEGRRRHGTVEYSIGKGNSTRRSTLAVISYSVQAKRRVLREAVAVVWMCFCIILLVIICTISRTSYYNVVYMVFYLAFVGYTIVRLLILENKIPDFEHFLRLLLFYSMGVFLIFYCVNFDFVISGHENIENFLNKNDLSPSFKTAIPIAVLLIAIKIQFDFFSSHFKSYMIELAEGTPGPGLETLDDEDEKPISDAITIRYANRLQKFFARLVHLLWIFFAIHLDKITLLALMGAILKEKSAFNFMLLIGLAGLCQFTSRFQKITQNVVFLMCCAVIILRMLYATSLTNLVQSFDSKFDCNCSGVNPWTNSTAAWMGLEMGAASDVAIPLYYLWPYLLVIWLALLNALVQFRMKSRVRRLEQKRDRYESGASRTEGNDPDQLRYCLDYRVLFPKVNRSNADVGFTNVFLYLINFGFYKFSLEMVALYVVTLASNVGDFFSALYVLFLMPMLLCKRKYLMMFAKVFAVYTTVAVIYKYMLLLWLPPLDVFCGTGFLDWIENSESSEMKLALKLFFFLYDFDHNQNYQLDSSALFPDLILLIILRSFLRNLKAEKINEVIRDCAGNNEDCLEEPDQARSQYGKGVILRIVYSTTNFLTEQRHPLNVLKKILFMHGIWITYFLVCLCGLQTADVFGAPFIGFGVYLLWKGQDVALKTRPDMFKSVNGILLYALVIAVFRILVQVTGFLCGDITRFDNLVLFVDLRVLEKYMLMPDVDLTSCENVFAHTGLLAWEGTCIMILLIQRRIFLSHYYDFVIEEAMITRELSYLGGKLIAKYNREDIAKAIEYRNKITMDLEEQINAIKNRSKTSGSWYDPVDHLDAIFSGSRFFSGKDQAFMGAKKFGSSRKFEKSTEYLDGGDKEDIGYRWIKYIEKIKERTIDRCFPGAGNDEENQERTESKEQLLEEDVALRDTHVGTVDAESNAGLQSEDGNVTSVPLSVPSTSHVSLESSLEFQEEAKVEEETFDCVSLESEDRPPGRLQKAWCLVVYALFRSLAELAWILDHGSAAFHRILLNLGEIRSARKGFLETSKLREDSVGGDVQEDVVTNNYVCVNLPMEFESGHKIFPSSSTFSVNSESAFNIYVLFVRDLWLTFYHFLIAQTDHFCYFLIGVVVVLSGSVVDMILAIVTLTWGLLSKPRPSNRFWKVVILYTTLSLFCKWFLQINLFPYKQDSTADAPLGLEIFAGDMQSSNSYIYTLVLLVAVCFHRTILLNFGLWSSYSMNRTEQESYKSQIRSGSCHFPSATDLDNESKCSEDAKSQVQETSFDWSASGMGSEQQLVEKSRLSICLENFKDWLIDVKDETKYFAGEILDSNKTAITDVYVPMFLFDMLGFAIVTLGYSGFSEPGGSSSILGNLVDNKVPFYYLVIMIVMFIFTMIDRLAYLTKNVLIKLINFIVQVVLVHCWLILINRYITGQHFHSNTSALLFYLVRWIYWLISAYQIKCSFPVRVLGNFFTKRYNKLCQYSMVVFFNAPFLFEMRVIMDWIFTPTTLKFSRWLQVEDAFVKTFIIKCQRGDEESSMIKRGEIQKAFPSKFAYLTIFIVLVLVIWAPIFFFSFLNTSKVSTEVKYASIELQLGCYEPIFMSTFTSVEGLTFAAATTKAIEDNYQVSSLDEDAQDVNLITFNDNAQQVWAVTPPSRLNLFEELVGKGFGQDYSGSDDEDDTFALTVRLKMTRKSTSEEAVISQPSAEIEISTDLSNTTRCQLACMIAPIGMNSSEYVYNTSFCEIEICNVNQTTLFNILPGYFTVDNAGIMKYLKSDSKTSDEKLNWQNFTVELRSVNDDPYRNFVHWWGIVDHEDVSIVTFDDKVVPQMFDTVAGYGIIGLYITFVVVVASKLKGAFSDYSGKIMFTEIPDVAPIQRLVLEMYMCREMRQFELEEDLYSQLQYLYRSPETMIENTKYKKDE